MSLIKIQGNSSLAKDQRSGAIINIDEQAYAAALARKKRIQNEKNILQRISSLESRIEELEKKIEMLQHK